MYFQRYWLRKIWSYKCLKRRVSEDPWTKNTVNGSTHCCNVNGSTFTLFINHCEGNCIEKKSLLVIHKILRLFVNTLTVDEKHYPLTRDNLTHSIQIQLSRKEKNFFSIFSCIFKIYIKFPKKR